MNFSEILDKFIKENAGPVGTGFYIEGANSLKPIVLKLYEACKDYEHIGVPSNGCSLSRHSSAAEALAEVERMIGEGKSE